MLTWNVETTPSDIQTMLEALAQDYPISAQPRGRATRMTFVPGGPQSTVEVELKGTAATIRYDVPSSAARGVGALLAGLVTKGKTYREQTTFTTFGIMLDCSRNAVMTVDHVKRWLRQLVLMGYNMAMLYTEDTYELPGEDYFGYLRGRYSAEDLREIDAYAAKLGVEMIGCIQTLGHLGQILRWSAYNKVKDTSTVLMVDEPASYDLIDKMIAQFATCYGSKRIHVGMDEAHEMARGRFLDHFGYQRPFDVFNRHLDKIVEICRKHGLKPMLWSDMPFRIAHPEGHYSRVNARKVPDDVRDAIPKDAQLVYWDYYNPDKDHYLAWFKDHRDLGFEPVMAGGVWTWNRQFWYGRWQTEQYATPCIRACRQGNVKEYIATMWGDNGGYCDLDSALAGLAYTAELAWGGDEVDAEALAKRFAAICGSDYHAVIAASDMNAPVCPVHAAAVMWDDPLLGIYWKNALQSDDQAWTKARDVYARVLDALEPHKKKRQPINLAHAWQVTACLKQRVEFGLALHKAYAARDKQAMAAVRGDIAAMLKTIDKTLSSLRGMWYGALRPQGFETMQIRFGALKERYRELSVRLGELIDGKIDSIPEIDETPTQKIGIRTDWSLVAAGTVII